MEDTAKYLIHADVTADGVVERSDVVGAVFGQTEGLLGTEMDLRKLQEASKVGRIDVDVESERGSSFGTITIASSLDRVETAVLAASLETISRVGPCRARVEVAGIEDVRAAKRRDVVDRAKELMTESFDGSMLSTQEILEEVRRSVRVEDVTQWKGLPAGPHVPDSDAIIVVEGRSDVLQLLQYGIKNAVAVEGTDVPEAVGDLTRDRTVTAFFDGDRGGDLILKELDQVGEVDYVALAPPGRSVEDLTRREVTESLREKMPYEVIANDDGGVTATDGIVKPASTGGHTGTGGDAVESGSASTPDPKTNDPDAETSREDVPHEADGGTTTADRRPGPANESPSGAAAVDAATNESRTVSPDADGPADAPEAAAGSADGRPAVDEEAPEPAASDEDEPPTGHETDTEPVAGDETGPEPTAGDETDSEPVASVEGTDAATDAPAPSTLVDHVREVIGDESGTVRLLAESYDVLAEATASEAFETIEAAEGVWAVVLDGELTQRVLDVAAQRGVAQIVARETGDFVKRPTSVRIRTADQLLAAPSDAN